MAKRRLSPRTKAALKRRLAEHGDRVFNKVSRSRAGVRCGTSPRGAHNRVCLSTHTIPGMKCGLNRITKLYGCAISGRAVRGPSRKAGRRNY